MSKKEIGKFSAPTVQVAYGWYGKTLELCGVRGNVFCMGLIEAPASGESVELQNQLEDNHTMYIIAKFGIGRQVCSCDDSLGVGPTGPSILRVVGQEPLRPQT